MWSKIVFMHPCRALWVQRRCFRKGKTMIAVHYQIIIVIIIIVSDFLPNNILNHHAQYQCKHQYQPQWTNIPVLVWVWVRLLLCRVDILAVGAANWGIDRELATLMGAIHTNGATTPSHCTVWCHISPHFTYTEGCHPLPSSAGYGGLCGWENIWLILQMRLLVGLLVGLKLTKHRVFRT